MMRMLLVSHTYVAPINRAKLDVLARHVTLTALVPARWRDALFTWHADCAHTTNYTLHAFRVRFEGHLFLKEYR